MCFSAYLEHRRLLLLPLQWALFHLWLWEKSTSVIKSSSKWCWTSSSSLYNLDLGPYVAMQHVSWPCLGRASASLLRLVRLSAPSWFRMLGSISVSCLVSAWPVMVKVLAVREACTLGLLKWITVPWFVNMLTCKKPKPLMLRNFKNCSDAEWNEKH